MSETNLAERRKAAKYADKMCGIDQTTKAWNDCFYRKLDTLIEQHKAHIVRVRSGSAKKYNSKSKVAFNITYADDHKSRCNGFDQVNRYYETSNQ